MWSISADEYTESSTMRQRIRRTQLGGQSPPEEEAGHGAVAAGRPGATSEQTPDYRRPPDPTRPAGGNVLVGPVDAGAETGRGPATGPPGGLEVLDRLVRELGSPIPPQNVSPAIYNRVRTDLGVLTSACRVATSAGGSDSTAEAINLAANLAHTGFGAGSADPVLRLVLAAQIGATDTLQQWRNAAWSAYLAHPGEYDRLLGDLIPTDFRADAQAELARMAYARGTNPTAADDWQVFLDRRQIRGEAETRAVTTGLPGLDAMLGGGLRELTFLGGRTGIGKTSLATFAIRSALRKSTELAVLYVQMDMAKEWVYEQLHSAESGAWNQHRGVEPVSAGAAAESSGTPGVDYLRRLRVLDRMNLPERCRPAEWQDVMYGCLVEAMQGLIRVSGTRTVLLVLDNFQRLDVPGVANDLERDVLRLNLLTRMLSATANDLHPGGMPILALSKIPKGRGPTDLAPDDLHGDSDLASRATAVLFIEPDPKRTPPAPSVAPLVVNVAKGRDGATRGRLPVDFLFREYSFREPGRGRFSSAARIEQQIKSTCAAWAESSPQNHGKAVE
jgi:hypothetical protein